MEAAPQHQSRTNFVFEQEVAAFLDIADHLRVALLYG
jgi:hypothetical protein